MSRVIFKSRNKIFHYFHFSIYLLWSDQTRCHDLSFLNVEFQASFFSFLFHFQEALQFLSAFCHKGGWNLMFEVTDISPGNLNSTCASSSPAFHMIYSAYKLNQQDDNIQPWRTTSPIWNQTFVPYPVLTVASWPAYRFLMKQVRWSGIPISWRIFHSFLWSTQTKPCAHQDPG